jgi:uncharacterized protein
MSYTLLTRGVLDGLGDSVHVSDTLDVPEVSLGIDVFASTGPVSFDVTLSNVGEGIIATGEVRGTFRTTCVRCLCDFEFDITGEVDGFFVHPEDEAGLPEEQERESIIDERIDLEPVIAASLVVELPFAPLHAEDCAGICPECGADRNEGDCGCGQKPAVSPFAKLKDVFPEAGEEAGPHS